MTSGGHPPDSATQLSPSSPPLCSLNDSDPGNSLIGVVPFYAPSAEAADLASTLAQKAGVDTCSKDTSAHEEDC